LLSKLCDRLGLGWPAFFLGLCLAVLAGCGAPGSDTERAHERAACAVLDRTDTDLVVSITPRGADAVIVQLVASRSTGTLCLIGDYTTEPGEQACPICDAGGAQ
jgi:hypothetical protein